MNERSKYLSVKIAIIVSGANTLLNVFDLAEITIFVMQFVLSWVLWCSVWGLVLDTPLKSERKVWLFKKSHVLFCIHVFASTITPFLLGNFNLIGR